MPAWSRHLIDRVAVSIASVADVLVEDVFDGLLDAEAAVVLFDVVLVDVVVVDIVRPIQKRKTKLSAVKH